jgi:hypothetical protein
MTTTRLRVLAALASGAAASMAVFGVVALREPATPAPAAVTVEIDVPAAARTGLPHQGDCGTRTGATVVQALCSDRAADVEVARVHLGGDPGKVCPLFRPDAVLFTTVAQDLFACWVPRGGGPRRSFEGPAPEIPAASVALVEVGMCGLIHDAHVHHPFDCADATVNGVARTVFAPEDTRSCPPGTASAETLADGSRVCWTAP